MEHLGPPSTSCAAGGAIREWFEQASPALCTLGAHDPRRWAVALKDNLAVASVVV